MHKSVSFLAQWCNDIDKSALHVDEIAERLLAVKGKPIATIKDYLNTSSIQEASNKEDATQMVDQLIEDSRR